MLGKGKEPKQRSIAVTPCGSSCSSASQVKAHSWYPLRCCGGEHCRKVDKIDFLLDGGMVMHAGAMEVAVPSYFPQEPSEDGDAHVCAVPLATGTYVPVCVFLRGTV